MADQRITASYSSRYTFTGKEQDALTGLQYFGARYYDARISLWYGVDPMAEEAPNWNPYRYSLNNPIRIIDPDGRFETIFEDENGNVLHETNDGHDFKVVVSNSNVECFKEAVCNSNNGSTLVDPKAEEKKTIDLFNNYAKDGQAMTTTLRKDGTSRVLSIGEASLNTVHQVGVTGSLSSSIVGPAVSAGVTWDSKGKVGLYGTLDLVHGLNIGLGVDYTQNVSYDPDFNIKSLNGYGVMIGGSVGPFGLSLGGNSRSTGNYGTSIGLDYKSATIELSLGPTPFGLSRTIGYTSILPIGR
jgi:RHS repeat-associated protein